MVFTSFFVQNNLRSTSLLLFYRVGYRVGGTGMNGKDMIHIQNCGERHGSRRQLR
jgi:hypothetical protein